MKCYRGEEVPNDLLAPCSGKREVLAALDGWLFLLRAHPKSGADTEIRKRGGGGVPGNCVLKCDVFVGGGGGGRRS